VERKALPPGKEPLQLPPGKKPPTTGRDAIKPEVKGQQGEYKGTPLESAKTAERLSQIEQSHPEAIKSITIENGKVQKIKIDLLKVGDQKLRTRMINSRNERIQKAAGEGFESSEAVQVILEVGRGLERVTVYNTEGRIIRGISTKKIRVKGADPEEVILSPEELHVLQGRSHIPAKARRRQIASGNPI
jgi:hypothetical protein